MCYTRKIKLLRSDETIFRIHLQTKISCICLFSLKLGSADKLGLLVCSCMYVVSSSSDCSQYPNCLIVWIGERIPETLPYYTTKWRDFTQVLKVSIPLTALALLSVTTDPPDIRSHKDGVSPPGDEQL